MLEFLKKPVLISNSDLIKKADYLANKMDVEQSDFSDKNKKRIDVSNIKYINFLDDTYPFFSVHFKIWLRILIYCSSIDIYQF